MKKLRFTATQGQYLAFLHAYTAVDGHAPSEAEMQQYFQVSPPSVHRMILALEQRGLIAREPGVAARSGCSSQRRRCRRSTATSRPHGDGALPVRLTILWSARRSWSKRGARW